LIYVIGAIGTDYVKIGRAKSVGKRLASLEGACPHDLEIIAVADWPDTTETAIHKMLEADLVKLEWFRYSTQTLTIIEWMRSHTGLAELREKAKTIGLTIRDKSFAQGREERRIARAARRQRLSLARAQEQRRPGSWRDQDPDVAGWIAERARLKRVLAQQSTAATADKHALVVVSHSSLPEEGENARP
jgi:hypothetical protein